MGHSVTANPIAVSAYPWQPESSKTGNRAIGDLGVGLMNSLKTARGIHTETLIVNADVIVTHPVC